MTIRIRNYLDILECPILMWVGSTVFIVTIDFGGVIQVQNCYYFISCFLNYLFSSKNECYNNDQTL